MSPRNRDWQPTSLAEELMVAGQRLLENNFNATTFEPQRLRIEIEAYFREVFDTDCPPRSEQALRKSKHDLLEKTRQRRGINRASVSDERPIWRAVSEDLNLLRRQHSTPDMLAPLLDDIAEHTGTAMARQLAPAFGREVFAGGLLRLYPFRGTLRYRARDVLTTFEPPDFPGALPADFDRFYEMVENELDPDLGEILRAYIARFPKRADGGLSPGLREELASCGVDLRRRLTRTIDAFDRDMSDAEPDLRAELDGYIGQLRRQLNLFVDLGRVRPAYTPRLERLGNRSLRTSLRGIAETPQDEVGNASKTGIHPLHVEFGPCDWWHVQAFNNQLKRDENLRQLAIDNEWLLRAIPPYQSGQVPSFVATHVVVTGGGDGFGDAPPYLVLTQRLLKGMAYYVGQWSLTLEENYMGPREVTLRGVDTWMPGDGSLHECARRGLHEELGLTDQDYSEPLLLGFFIEADFASCIAVFWTHLRVDWDGLKARVHDVSKIEQEVNAVAREPLTTENLARLFLQEEYTPSDGDGRDFFVLRDPPGTRPFHPAAKGRLLQYMLADEERHPPQRIVEAFAALGFPHGYRQADAPRSAAPEGEVHQGWRNP